jgi:hypothetical protein
LSENKLRAQIGYKYRYLKGGAAVNIADNILARDIALDKPKQT